MKSESTLLSHYDFNLPEGLIAQSSVLPRDHSKLMVVEKASGKISHRGFFELPELLKPNDLLVANQSKVIKARLLGHRILDDGSVGGAVEFFLIKKTAARTWEGMFQSAAKQKAGLRFQIPLAGGSLIQAKLVRGAAEHPHGFVVGEFDRDPVEADAGFIPLPPYVTANPLAESQYQTAFAKHLGSVAAPTAGFHFTGDTFKALKTKGISWEELSLHVGIGTFRPIKTPDIRDHLMHEEFFEISETGLAGLAKQREAGDRVIAVGTTTLRALETLAALDSSFKSQKAGQYQTSIFIHPGARRFLGVDGLITNFHLPKSTLFILVCAFLGRDLAFQAYQTAIESKYRFYSFGDAMLLLP